MDNKNPPKNTDRYVCESCLFKTQHRRDYDNHLLTAKHKRITNGNNMTKTPTKFICICGKEYRNRHTLSRHRKYCDYKEIVAAPVVSQEFCNSSMMLDIINDNREFKSLLIEQLKENKELMNKLIEVSSNPTTINNNNNNTTNNNQKFNLNFFLNETCKDAMSIEEFINNIRITVEDLLTIGDAGFVNGVSDIFVKQLRDLDVSKRPIHCTDSKRETIYLKENAAWNKDNHEKSRLKQIIERVEYKNVSALRDWCNENPDSKINNTPNNLLRDKIYMETLQGDDHNRDKIIKNISKEIMIDKDK
jgi:hypothetical protein